MSAEKYPPAIMEVLKATQLQTGVEIQEVMKVFEDYLNNPWIKQDPQFKTEEDMMNYSASMAWIKLFQRGKMEDYTVIPYGFGCIRPTQTGKRQGSVLALVKGKTGDTKPRRIVFFDEDTVLINRITPLCQYSNVSLGTIGRDLRADVQQTSFKAPVKLEITQESMLEKIGARRIAVTDAERYPSRRGSDGYIDTFDWRIIRGLIFRQNIFDYKNSEGKAIGLKGATITVVDRSYITSGEKPIVDENGNVNLGITAWILPSMCIYQDFSECDFSGTITIGRKDKRPSMEAYVILPVHAKLKVM